jgi:hypothetical protein
MRDISSMYLYGYHNTWYDSDGNSTFYEITNANDTVQYYMGQLCSCNGGGLPCNINLPAGEYMWHVSGGNEDSTDWIAWEYCGLIGSIDESFLFTVSENGTCTPLVDQNITTMSYLATEMANTSALNSSTPVSNHHGKSSPSLISPNMRPFGKNADNIW